MCKRLFLYLIFVFPTLQICTPDYQLSNVQTSTINFNVQPSSSQLTFPQQFYGYTLTKIYSSIPSVALGIQSIQANTGKLQKFMVKVQHASESFITFVFLYKNFIWSNLNIFFVVSNREDLLVGSVETNFQSLRGDRALTKVSFNQKISNYTSSVGRVFLNGFSSNFMKSLQLGISQSTIKETQMLINVVTGPGFDLKQIWFSFIVFSPNLVPFASYGRTYQQMHFKGKKTVDSSGNIYSSQHRFLGLTLLSFLNLDEKIHLQTEFDEKFILQVQAQSFIDKFTVSYIVFGKNTGEVCEKCEGKIPFLNQCHHECEFGSYQYMYSDGGKACRLCSSKLNQIINNNSTGCQCNVNSYLKQGKCEKRKAQTYNLRIQLKEEKFEQIKQKEQVKRIQLTPQKTREEQFSKYEITKLPLKQEQPENLKCQNMKNSYWTGFRCACKTGYLPLQGGCESFAFYVKSLSYSSTLYPTQFSYIPSHSQISQSPCKIQQLRTNGKCICKDNYYRSASGVCQECQPHSTYSASAGQCICNKGYRINYYGKCQISCSNQMALNVYGQCVCPPGKALLNNYCIPCNPDNGGYILNNRCFYCPGDLRFDGKKCGCGLDEVIMADTCMKCDQFQTVYNNICQCFPPYERNPYTYLCEPKCSPYQIKFYGRCIYCPINSYNNGNDVCVCEEGYEYQNGVCRKLQLIKCQQGTYQMNNVCVKCHQGCLSCVSANFCFVCSSNGYRMIGGKCYETCGDGKITGRQTCDDGNTFSYDGCSSTCSQEAGYHCYGRPSFCSSICGNGIITRYEQCDDGNRRSGDGCSGNCQVQYGSRCGGQPSRCWN